MCSDILTETQETIAGLVRGLDGSGSRGRPRLLDVGCWTGHATMRYANLINADAYGIEVFENPAREAERNGVQVAQADLERQRFPWDDATFDVVVANQVFEHLKNIWLPLSEVHRVLRPGGHFLISVPNLASLHNRLLLLLGVQPTSIRVLGPHVRGYTIGELVGVLTLDDAMACRHIRGVGFYPLSTKLARPFARLWPSASHTMILVAQKTDRCPEPPWRSLGDHDSGIGGQTFYA